MLLPQVAFYLSFPSWQSVKLIQLIELLMLMFFFDVETASFWPITGRYSWWRG